jgi:hypothetical protein
MVGEIIMKEKVNELINAPVLDIFEAERVYQELAKQQELKKSFKDFAVQLMANATTPKDFAEVMSDLNDIINDVKNEAQDKKKLQRQKVIIKRIYE